jgi:hypothetical protein
MTAAVEQLRKPRKPLAGRYSRLGRCTCQRRGPAFLLGTHQASWLWDPTVTCPLFVSRRRLAPYKKLRRATHPWYLDSGGFTELSTYGQWTITPRQYLEEVARYQREIGKLVWAAPMDHMCEPAIINGGVINGKRFPGTGENVAVHIKRTVWNYVTLIDLWPEYSDDPCPIIPVLQGWALRDYLWCADIYLSAGVNLRAMPVVGLGGVCRRQSSLQILSIALNLAMDGIKLHGFGVKTEGLAMYAKYLVSSDSLAWSTDARHCDPLLGHTHKNCANCPTYALAWREELLARMPDPGEEPAAA